MAQVIIRNIEDAVVDRLKRQAVAEGTSLENRLRRLVTEASRAGEDRFDRIARRIQEKTRGAGLDVTALIREDRDR